MSGCHVPLKCLCSSHELKKEPFKCPVCNGLGCLIVYFEHKKCIACDGKGIVWG